ncbi:hypothetical protein B0H14DRAFT_2643154 [Mycena olivaceomarginata]|nr:hypothetical protein B0H14DRAFT_2643154 [Mycena olivaceomarginata]
MVKEGKGSMKLEQNVKRKDQRGHHLPLQTTPRDPARTGSHAPFGKAAQGIASSEMGAEEEESGEAGALPALESEFATDKGERFGKSTVLDIKISFNGTSFDLELSENDESRGETADGSGTQDTPSIGALSLYHSASTHEIDSTFFRASPDPKGNIFYPKSDGTPFVTNFVAEIGSEAQGTWMAAYPKKSPPALAPHVRCPTGATPEFCAMFQSGLTTCDGLCGKDETLEAANAEVPYSSRSIKDSSTSPRTPRKRISKVDPAAKSPELPDEMTAMDIVPPESTRPYFAHDKAELVQWNYTDKDGKLIGPEELYATLTEGTLVLVVRVVSLATYVIRDQKTESGVSPPGKKIYHVLIDQLKVLDRGDAEPWNPPVPEILEARVYSPMTNVFGSKSSPSLPKRARHSGAGSS